MNCEPPNFLYPSPLAGKPEEGTWPRKLYVQKATTFHDINKMRRTFALIQIQLLVISSG